jgi:hypothetical protein
MFIASFVLLKHIQFVMIIKQGRTCMQVIVVKSSQLVVFGRVYFFIQNLLSG